MGFCVTMFTGRLTPTARHPRSEYLPFPDTGPPSLSLMGKRAILFPGQGAQYVGMGRTLAEAVPEARAVFDEANEVLGFDLARVCFDGPLEELTKTDVSQPAILTHSMAVVAALRATRGDDALAADATCGLSLGEYTALVFAGVLTFAKGVRLVRARGRFMQDACDEHPTGMASVLKAYRETVQRLADAAAESTGEHCVLANLLADGNIAVAGGLRAIEKLAELGKAEKARVMPLPVAGAFHSPYMKSAEERLAAEIESTPMQAPTMPVISNVDARPAEAVEAIRANLVRQLTSAVSWSDSMAYLLGEDFDRFAEFGPGKVLCGLLRRSAPDTERTSLGEYDEIGRHST